MKRPTRAPSLVLDVVVTILSLAAGVGAASHSFVAAFLFIFAWPILAGLYSLVRMGGPIGRLTVPEFRESLAVTPMDPKPFLLARLRPAFVASAAPTLAPLAAFLMFTARSPLPVWFGPSTTADWLPPLRVGAVVLVSVVESVALAAHASFDLLRRLCRTPHPTAPTGSVALQLFLESLLYQAFCSVLGLYLAFGGGRVKDLSPETFILIQLLFAGVAILRAEDDWHRVAAAYLVMDPPSRHWNEKLRTLDLSKRS